MSTDHDRSHEQISTGVPGLDAVLHGGLLRYGFYLVTGPAGGGKTTLGLQFLIEGRRQGESVLYLSLSQRARGLRQMGESHGLDLSGIEIQDIASHDFGDLHANEQTVFHSSEVELRETMTAFLDAAERLRPHRIVFDSVSELKLLAGDGLGYRRSVLALRQYLVERECTTLLLQPVHGDGGEGAVRDLSSGVIELTADTPVHGEIRRSLQVTKMRGATFDSGHHSFAIRTGGVQVFPRVTISGRKVKAPDLADPSPPRLVSSGVADLDAVLGGGLTAGTSCLIAGPSGSGKSSLAAAFAFAAAQRGERAAVFLFEERPETFLARCATLGFDLRPAVRDGRVSLRLVDTGAISPGEFANDVIGSVEEGAEVVVIDSLTSYQHAVPSDELLANQMLHLLLNLSERNVVTLLTAAQQGVVGTNLMGSDVSYLADSLILLRHFEAGGTLRRALSVVKRRTSEADAAIREIHFSPHGGIRLSGPLRQFVGILTGTPRYEGDQADLIDRRNGDGGEAGDVE